MRDTKSILLLIVSFLLLIVSCVLLYTWGYRVYKDSQSSKNQSILLPPKAVTPTLVMNDSLPIAIQQDQQLDAIWNNAGELKNQLDEKLNEFNKLRNEINAILKNPGSNADLGIARQKITTLQQIVEELRVRNKDVEKENKRLQEVLQQLSVYMKPVDSQIKRVGLEEKIPVENSNSSNAFTATDLRLTALLIENEREEETMQAAKTGKMVGSFLVKNINTSNNNTDLVVVVLQPDGRVLKASAWESGIFNTPEGKKIYSYKLKVDLSRGETRRMLFTLQADKYQQGNYTMQIYYNGMMIGKMYKTLS